MGDCNSLIILLRIKAWQLVISRDMLRFKLNLNYFNDKL